MEGDSSFQTGKLRQGRGGAAWPQTIASSGLIFFPSLRAPTEAAGPCLMPLFKFIMGSLAPGLIQGEEEPGTPWWSSSWTSPPPPPLVGKWGLAFLPPLDSWQFLLPAVDWDPATLQHYDWHVNLGREHTSSKGGWTRVYKCLQGTCWRHPDWSNPDWGWHKGPLGDCF